MLKYTEAKVVTAEIPDEITLAINISGCPCNCEGCHSSYLAEDTGTPLTREELHSLTLKHRGISCISFMGGDADPKYINWLAASLRVIAVLNEQNFKIAWYSGRSELSSDIDLDNFDYIKLGPYIKEKGPLNSKTTNQKFYEVERLKEPAKDGNVIAGLKDITYKFWK